MGAIQRAFIGLFGGEQYGPPDRYSAAISAEPYIGTRGSPNVTISRRRLRDLMRHAFDVGADWQVQQQAAAASAAPVFPPKHVATGIYRLRLTASTVTALWSQWLNRRFIGSGCYRAEPGSFQEFLCIGDGLMEVAFAASLVFLATSLVMWAVYRVVVWVWLGFRGG